MFLPAFSTFLLILLWVPSVIGFRIAPRDDVNNGWELWEDRFKREINNHGLPEWDPVTISLAPTVADPFHEMRTLFGISRPKPMKQITKTTVVTSDSFYFDELSPNNHYRNAFEYDNSKSKAAIFVLITTKGNLILRFGPNFLEKAIKPEKGQRKKLFAQDLVNLPKFTYFVSHLSLGQEITEKPLWDMKTLKLDTFDKNPPTHTLTRFMSEVNRKGGTPLVLFTVRDPDSEHVQAGVEAITLNIKQIVHKDLEVVPIEMDVKTPGMSQELGVYTYRGPFKNQAAHYVSVLYGHGRQVAVMIPILSNDCQVDVSIANPSKIPTPTKAPLPPKVPIPPNANEIKVSKDQPTIEQSKWGRRPSSWWFDSNLDTLQTQLSRTVASKNKITAFLVVTNERRWLLTLPPSFTTSHFIHTSQKPITLKKRKENWEEFAREYLHDPNQPDSFAAFRDKMGPGEKVVMYLTLAASEQWSGGRYAWKYMDVISPTWKIIDELALVKKMPGVNDIQFLVVGQQILSTKTKFLMTHSFNDPTQQSVVEIAYDDILQLRIKLAPLGSSPLITDEEHFQGVPMPITEVVKRSTKLVTHQEGQGC